MPRSDRNRATATPPDSRAHSRRSQGFRPDIEGLRAVAIGLVLLYHGGLDQLTGGFVGVDVFFVISGFLITGLLIRELERSGRVSLARFYARRARRLLPATAVVLGATALLTWMTIRVIEWRTFGMDIVTAALYVVNWQLAGRSVDYLAEDVGVSPVQHFWSLAVEEQFYIVWPLLLVAIAWWVRHRRPGSLRPAMTVGILLIVLPSLAYSIHLTSTSAATAFFVTPTRLWELGVGALVAIGAHHWLRLPRWFAALLGWLGLTTVLLSALVFSSATPWPGYHALAPTLGTAAVVVAGFAAGRAGPALVLSWRPAVWVGGLSYSLYLWHWPLIVCATALWGDLGTKKGLLVMALSFIPAYLCYRAIENPIRFSRSLGASNKLTLSTGANFTLIGVIAGLVLMLAVPTSTGGNNVGGNTGTDGGSDTALGAAVLSGADSTTTGGDGTVESLEAIEWFIPNAVDAPDDVPAAYERGCQLDVPDTAAHMCEYGDPDGDVVIAVVGDSKILQWESALGEIAEEHGWRVLSFTKSACAFTAAPISLDGEPYTQCTEWNTAVMDALLDLGPDLVLSSQVAGTAFDAADPDAAESEDAMVAGLVEHWSRLSDAGIRVGVLLDVPHPPYSVFECVAEKAPDLDQCAFSREDAIGRSPASVQLEAAEETGAEVIDMTDTVCPEDMCVPVIGNVLVYRQGGHITDTYVRTAAPALEEQLVPVATGSAA